MSSIRVSGNTSGYYDLTVPDIAGQNTIPLNQVVTTDTNGHLQISGGSTNNDDTAAVITAASTEHAKIRIDTSSTSNHRATLALESGSYEVNIATSGLDEMRFSTQNTSDALFIGSNGRIGIGTTGPVEGLEVFGTSGADNIALKYSGTAGGHQSGYLWKDFRGQPNAGIYNNLQNDAVGSAAAHMEFYTSNAGTMTKQMGIDRYGYITKPNQPGFSSYKNGSQTEQSGDHIITSWTENFDHGGVFNASTGRFTAPVTGKYLLMLSLMHSGNVVGDLQYRIWINGTYYQGSNDTADGSSWDQCTVVTIAYMNANDYADPIAYSNNTSSREIAYNNRYCGWHGYLLG